MRIALIAAVLVSGALAVALAAQTEPNSPPAQPKEIPSFDLNALDRTASPCADFYQFACGNWVAHNPIPPDQPAWGRFAELAERNRDVLHAILEKAAAPNPGRDAVQQKIGDYYYSCMDESAINQKGLAPLKPYLDAIDAIRDKDQLPQALADLHRRGVNAFFRFGSDQDFKDASQEIAETDQGGLGLPERDYYLKTDKKSEQIRQDYVAHIQKMLELLGEPAPQAAADAATVLKLETDLAKASLPVVDRRDPQKIYHKMSTTQLQSLDPAFTWSQYLVAVQAPPITSLNVAVPQFLQGMNAVLSSTSLDDIKTYLRWQLVHAAAPVLPTVFEDENFNFYGKELTGQKEQRARWKRCVRYTDSDLGEALGQPYVKETFPPDAKARTLKMVQALEIALGEDIQRLSWMSDATKKQALDKLHEIANKIGYPDHWRDYSKLDIVRGDALGNSLRANSFEFNRQLNKIGKPVDRKEWLMSPPTVNAYYDPQMNDINFPAGILQPPFFSNSIDDAVNFGAIGAVIGHELTHGFDDQGRQFDGKGNLRDWWTPQDAKRFEQRAQCIVNEYDNFTAVDDMHVNGKLTLGENTADNGGLRISRMALENTLAGKDVPPVDGFTPDQRFFIGWGQIWCENMSNELLRLQVTTDPHSPPKDRVNGVVRNMPEFEKAFQCKPQSPMVSKDACRVW